MVAADHPASHEAGYGEADHPASHEAGHAEADHAASHEEGYAEADHPASHEAGYGEANHAASHEAGYAEADHPATRKPRGDCSYSPHVEGGVGNFGGEGLGEQRQRLIFTLQLATVGEDLAVDFDGAVLEEDFIAASVAEGCRGGERDVKFSSETGVAFADGQDIAAVSGDGSHSRE